MAKEWMEGGPRMVKTWNRKISLERIKFYKYLHRHRLFDGVLIW